MTTAEPLLILFDCDGTLVDSQRMIIAAMDRAFASQQRPTPSPQATLSIVGLSLSEAITQLAPDVPASQRTHLVDAYKNAFSDLVGDTALSEPLYDGARACVEALAQQPQVLLGVATGKSRRGVKRLFDRENMHPHFQTIQTADTNPSKPNPGMIEAGMSEVGTYPSRTLMIGDTTFDMEMARAANVTAIGVAWGYHPVTALERAGAHLVLHSFDELNTYLFENWLNDHG